MTLPIAAALGYVIGSVPYALLIARLSGVDIRRAGSGNIGTANVQRTLGSGAAAVTAILDIAKGMAPVLLVRAMGGAPAAEAVAGVAAIAGHVFPVWLAFRGGKGVATTLGACAAWSPAAAAVAAGIFLAVVMTLRLVSLGSLLAAVAAGPTAYALGAPRPVVVALFAAAALIVVRHRDNIMRLAAGTERRIGGFGRDRTSR